MTENVIENNKIVKIDYVGTDENGVEFDNSVKRGQPLQFLCGFKQIIPGLENELIGMKTGDKKKVIVESGMAYGAHNASLIQKVPKEHLPKDMEVKVGMTLALKHPEQEQQIPAKVLKVGETEIELDMNHPLAGKTLTFDVEIKEVRDLTKDEKEEIAKAKKEFDESAKNKRECCGSGNCHSEDKEAKDCCDKDIENLDDKLKNNNK